MSALDRELIKWIQSMDLSHPLKNPRRDLGNGFLVAEILSRYDRNVEMHSFDTGSAMSRRLDNWQQIRKLLANRNCTTVTEEMMDSAIQMRGEGASNVLEALYEHLTKKRLQAGKITAQKKEAEAANEDLKAKAVLETPAFMRPTAAALLRENNDETVNRLQRLTGRTNEDHINKKNEELLARHGQIMQAAKEASPERYEPKKPNTATLKGLLSPNGTMGGPRPAWGENTQNSTDGASSRARQKLVVAKHLDVRVVDESVLATFAAREQQAKEEALKNGFDTRESLPVALSRVVYRILQSYGIVEAVDEGYDEIYGEGRSDVNPSYHAESDGLGMLIDSRVTTTPAASIDADGGDGRRDSTNTQTPSVAAGENEDVAGTGDYFTKFIVLRERIPMEIKTYVWNSLVTATEIGASPPQSAPTDEQQSPLRERGSSSKTPVGIVARNTARLIADRPSEFQHLAVLFTFALGREAAQIALPPSLYGANVQDFSNNAENRNSEQAASFATDCQFVYRFLETVGQSLGDKSNVDGGGAPTSRSNNGLSADTADYATKLLIPQLLSSYLLPQGTSFILEWCARLILAYTPVRHASEIRSVLDSLRRSLTSTPATINNNNNRGDIAVSSVGVLNDRFYVVAMTFLSQVLFDAVASPSGSGGNASLLYSALCDVNISVAKEALLGSSTTTYKSTPTAASKAAGLHLLRRTMLPYDVMTYHQSFTPSLINPDVLNNQTSTIGPLPTATLTTAAVNRFRNMGDASGRGGNNNNNSGGGVTVEGVPAMADQLLAVAASLALRGPTNGMRGQGSGLSPTVLQQVFALDEVPSTPTASALRTVTSMLAQQLPRFLLLESAFRAPKHLGASGTHQLLNNEILDPFHHYMTSHSHDRSTAKSELLAKKFEKLRGALIEQRRLQIEEHSQGESTLGEDEIREIYLLSNEDLLEIARSEMDPETTELAALDNNNNNDNINNNGNSEEEEGEEDHAVLMHRFFTGAVGGEGGQRGCWLGKALIAAAQDDSNWEVRLAALEAASVLKYSAERFVVEAQLSPDVDAALGELVAAEEASLEYGDAESPQVVEKRLALEKSEQRLSSAANFLETVVGRAQESAFIYFASKSPALRRMSMVAVAPFLLKPPPQSTTIDEDGNLVNMHLDNSTSIMASLFVQRIVEELRDSVSESVSIAATHMKAQRNKRPTSSNNVGELMQHLISKNAASMRLKALAPASVAYTFPFDLRWGGEDSPTSTTRSTEPAVVVGGKVVSSSVCSSVLQFVDPLVLASCVVTHMGHGQAELRALEEHVQEEQQYQQATLGGAEGARTADDAAADISAFVAQHTSPVCSTFEVTWLLESIFSRAVHLSGVSAQLSGLISAAAASAAAASGTLDDDEGDTKSAISTTSTSAAARLALRQRNKAAGSPQALSISASITNNPTHQRYQAFLEAVDSSTRQGWLRVLAEVKSHLLDSVSDPENIQQSTFNEPMMNAIDEVGAALQHQFQRDRVEAQQRAKEGGSGSEATTPTLESSQQQQLQQAPPPDAGDIFAREVQQRCFHILTKVYRDLKNANVGQGKGFEGGANPQDEGQIAAERDAAVDWLVTML